MQRQESDADVAGRITPAEEELKLVRKPTKTTGVANAKNNLKRVKEQRRGVRRGSLPEDNSPPGSANGDGGGVDAFKGVPVKESEQQDEVDVVDEVSDVVTVGWRRRVMRDLNVESPLSTQKDTRQESLGRPSGRSTGRAAATGAAACCLAQAVRPRACSAVAAEAAGAAATDLADQEGRHAGCQICGRTAGDEQGAASRRKGGGRRGQAGAAGLAEATCTRG